MYPRLVARLVFGCHTSVIQLPSLLLNSLVFPCGTRNFTRRFQLNCVGTKQLVPLLYSIVHHGHYFSLLAFLSTPHTTRQTLRRRSCCATLVTLCDHMKHSSRGDLHAGTVPEVPSKHKRKYLGVLHWIKVSVG